MPVRGCLDGIGNLLRAAQRRPGQPVVRLEQIRLLGVDRAHRALEQACCILAELLDDAPRDQADQQRDPGAMCEAAEQVARLVSGS